MRQFRIFSKQSYSGVGRHDAVDQISVEECDSDGCCTGEFRIKLVDLSGCRNLTPAIEMFDDAWHLFVDFVDVFQALAKLDNTDATAGQIALVLKSCGFQEIIE